MDLSLLISVYTGAAWLSSARAVRCPVKSGNERNPYYQLPSLRVGTLVKLLVKTRGRRGRRQVIMALMSWATHMLQWRIQRVANSREVANPIKVRLSSNCRLQLACMKLESLVIADQHAAVNTFLSLVHTARQVMEAGSARSRRISTVPTARLVTGTKS